MTDHPIGHPASPYLTLAEAADFCRFDTCANPVIAFRKWCRRHHVPVVRRGRVLLVNRQVLEHFLEGKAWTVRRRSA